MYFDVRPKQRLEDLYNFREEFNQLVRYLEGDIGIVVVTGLRRTGKTSLVLTALNSLDLPYVLVNGYSFAGDPYISRVDFIRLMEVAINDLLARCQSMRGKLREVLGMVSGVEIELHPFPHLRLSWGRRPGEGVNLALLLKVLGDLSKLAEDKPAVMVFDEAQEFSKLRGFDLVKLLAYVHDHVGNLKVVITGSQFGFLHQFLKLEDPQSPLYGRYCVEVKTRKLTREESIEFLEMGFEQIGMKPDREILERAVEVLDGVIGWLTYLGVEAKNAGRLDEKLLEKTLDKAAGLASQELENFLRYREEARKRYLLALKAVGEGRATWSEIKRTLEAHEGRGMLPSVLSNILRNLQNAGFVEKIENKYGIADPVIEKAVEQISTPRRRRRS